MTHYDNQTQGTAWYDHKEVNLANNVSRLIFEVASVDVQLLRPDVLDCVEDNTFACVYPIDQVEDHAFSMELVNGVLEGDYNIKLMVTDMASGSVIFNEASAESPMTLAPHERASASWAAVAPSSGWTDGGNYNFSFYAELADDGSASGNTWDFTISMADMIDVAILSNPTDQNRLSRVKEDLSSMGMTYTQLYVEDWDRYVTSTWMNHYNKILLPWQTTINVEAGNYYTELNAEGGSDGLSPMAVIKNRMSAGATLEMHLGPYSNIFQDPLSNLPYDINVANRNVEGNFVTHTDTAVVDWHHPLLSDVNPVAFISFNGGHHVAESTLITTLTDVDNIPQVCQGSISAPFGSIHCLIDDATGSTDSL